MKLHKILFVGAIGLLGACTPDNEFLEENPKDKITMENAFNTSDQVLSTVLSAYNLLEGNYFPQGMNSDMFSYKQLGTDILDCKYSNPHYSNFTTSWSPTMGFIKTVWDNYYKMISYCNLALLKINDVTWTSEADKARVEAEAKFLRGLAYLRLAEYYGAVPLVKEFSETARFDYVREPRATVYSSAITDMEEAYNNGLPDNTVASGEAGRVSKYAAAMFLAEAYLARGVENGDDVNDFRTAVTYAQEVISHHPLMTSRFGVRLPGASGLRNGVPTAQPDGNVFSDLFVSDNMISGLCKTSVLRWMAMPANRSASTSVRSMAVKPVRLSTVVRVGDRHLSLGMFR